MILPLKQNLSHIKNLDYSGSWEKPLYNFQTQHPLYNNYADILDQVPFVRHHLH